MFQGNFYSFTGISTLTISRYLKENQVMYIAKVTNLSGQFL